MRMAYDLYISLDNMKLLSVCTARKPINISNDVQKPFFNEVIAENIYIFSFLKLISKSVAC